MTDLATVGRNEVRTEYRLSSSAEGVSATISAAERLKAAETGLIGVTEKKSRVQESYANRVERLAKAYDPYYRALKQIEDAERTLAGARASGLDNTRAIDRLESALAARRDQLAKATNGAASANDNLARSAERARLASLQHPVQQRVDAVTGVRPDLGVAQRAADVAAYGAELDRVRARYDPLFRAQQAYRAGLEELRSALAVGAIAQSAYTAELDRRKQAFAEQVRGLGLLSAAEKTAAAATEESARRMERARAASQAQDAYGARLGVRSDFGGDARAADVAAYGAELDRLRAKYSPLFAAQQQYKAALVEIGHAARVGALTEAERGAAIDRTKAALAQQVVLLRGAGAGHAALTKSLTDAGVANDNFATRTGLAADQLKNLGFQANDVATMLAMGASPLQILASQGGQVLQILQSSDRGVVGALRGMGSALVGLVSPAVAVGAALLAIGVAAVAGIIRHASEMDRLRDAVTGVGAAAGVTAEALARLADRGAAAAGISVSSGRDLAAAYAATGKVGAENMERLIGATKRFGEAMNLDLAGAGERLAAAMADPLKVADELNEKFGFLSDAMREHIRQLQDAGSQTDAQRAFLDALAPSLDAAAQKTGVLAQMWEWVKRAASDAASALGGAVNAAVHGVERGLQVQLGSVQAQLKAARELQAGPLGKNASILRDRGYSEAQIKAISPDPQAAAAGAEVERLTKLEGDLQEQMRRTNQLADQRGKDFVSRAISVDAGKIARDLEPLNAKYDSLIQRRGKLEAALARPEYLSDVAAVQKAYDATARAIQSITDANGKLISSDQIRARQDEISLKLQKEKDPAAKAALAAEQETLKLKGEVITKEEAERRVTTAKAMAYEQAAAAKKKEAGAGSDAYDNAIQRGRDQIEELKLQAEMAGKTREEVYKLTEANRLWRAARSAGRADEKGIAEEIARTSDALAKQRVETEKVIETQRQLREAQDFVADSFKSFFDEMISGSGKLEDAFKSLGKAWTAAALDAFINGKGPLAGMAGLAASEKGQQGGLLGALMGNDVKAFRQAVADGTKEGFEGGMHRASADLARANKEGFLGGLGVDGKTLAGGLTALAGLAGAYGAGMSAGSTGQAAIGGALSGAMAGMMLPGGPVTAAIGAAIGAGLGILGKESASKQAREERKREADAAYANAKPDIATLQTFLTGQGIGATRKAIEDTLVKVNQAGTLARNAGDAAEMHRLQANALDYQVRTLKEYRDAFGGLMESMRTGLGPSSPFSQAQEAIKSLGEQLKGMVDDAAYAFGEGSAEIGVAKAAARDYALTVLNGARELTTVQVRLEEIQGTAAGLTKILTDLGMAAADTGAAVDKGVAAAIARLKASFEDDLARKINDASGKGYLNEARDLIKEVTSLRGDAGRLGTDPALVERYFSAAAQKIVDGAQLAGDELQALVNAFPALSGVVHDFTASVDAATIAARRLAYQDRLFAAANDTSTLGGQLAAFERQAQRQREEEIKAGGQAMADLEAALLAERYNVIKAYNEQAAAAEKQRYEEAAGFLATFTRRIQEFVDGLRAGSSSPLSPEARLAAAQSQYASQLALAKTGDRDALNGITSYASDLLEAAKAYYASSGGYQTIFEQIASQLSALPKQLSAEQLIVNAIDASKAAVVSATEAMRQAMVAAVNAGPTATASALSSYFAMLDTTMDGAISYQEMLSALGPMATRQEQEWARQIFSSIDADGNGQIDKLELIRARTAATEANTGNTKSAVDNTTYQAQLTAQNVAGLNALLNAVNATNTSQYVMMQGVHNLLYAHGDLLANIRWNLYYANTRAFGQGNSNPVPSYAAGGWVNGPGTGTSDSITARLSNGEFVMPAAQARLYGGMLEQMRAGNARVPVLPMPVAANDAAPSYRELLQAVQQLKAEVAALTTVTRQGAALVGTEVSKVRDSVEHGNELAADTNKTARRAKAAA